MSVLIIDAHPNADSLTAALAQRYANAASGAEVLRLRELKIDPILHHGLRQAQPIEPDLARAAELMVAARHIVIATPVWWDSTPALLKGFLDRVLQARWAYRYRGGIPQGLLKGRTARILITADSPWWYLRFVKRSTPVRQLVQGTLKFVGIKPVRVSRFTGVRSSTTQQRATWLERAEKVAVSDMAWLERRRGHVLADPGPLVPYEPNWDLKDTHPTVTSGR